MVNKGGIPWNKGKKMSEETKRKLSKALKRYHKENQGIHKKWWEDHPEAKKFGNDNPMTSKENRERMKDKNPLRDSEIRERYLEAIKKRKLSGEHHWNWQGGISSEPYGTEFNEALRVKIRERDQYTCQVCFTEQDNLARFLDVHHIDYDKTNNYEGNLISLCISCHFKTNVNRVYWEKFFRGVN